MSFLGVEESAKGFRWVERVADAQAVTDLQKVGGLDALQARLLAARGIGAEEIQNFLKPRLRDLLPDPARLKGFSEFADTLLTAIADGQTIGILADYDADGATSAGVLVAMLRALGAPFALYVPDRLAEGYGPSDQAFQFFASQSVRTVVCLDCGSMAHGPVQRAEAGGIQVLIIDHHQIAGEPPRVSAHINPNQAGCDSGIGACAAVGVCFVVMVGLKRAAAERGMACDLDLLQVLDLVALGTVCDVVPLRGLNRAFVLQGLKVWQQTTNPGLQALLNILPKRPTFDGSLAGFQVGPRLNAAGRIGPSDLAAKILTSDKGEKAARLAGELDRLNVRRREIESQVLAQARLQLAEMEDAPCNLVADPSWHPGVVGVVAGRLKDSTGKPSIVLGGDGSGPLTGSGRSVPGFDMGGCILNLRERGMLLSGGGHAMAAGLKLEADKVPDLRVALNQALSHVPEAISQGKTREVDFAIRPGAATAELAKFLGQLQPFGAQNPEPKVVIEAVRVTFMQMVGKNHLKVTLEDGGGHQLKGIAFRASGSNLETVLRKGRDQLVHIAGSLTLDEWGGGDSAQVLIDDAALARNS